ncbi:response regulator transcription factor [Rubritalea sp.]|uniref:response regulator transcription factor n=1 Tax=Rubritalea sp. TaxID=2109375 RepID=UPI003EF8B4DD
MDIKPNRYVAIVDDDDSICRSFSRLLKAVGFSPVSYSSAEAFLADSERPPFDCLLLDIQMAGISGLELKHKLSAANDKTPVIFITAHDSPEVKEEAIVSGCLGYFGKTDSGKEIINLIKGAVTTTRDNLP